MSRAWSAVGKGVLWLGQCSGLSSMGEPRRLGDRWRPSRPEARGWVELLHLLRRLDGPVRLGAMGCLRRMWRLRVPTQLCWPELLDGQEHVGGPRHLGLLGRLSGPGLKGGPSGLGLFGRLGCLVRTVAGLTVAAFALAGAARAEVSSNPGQSAAGGAGQASRAPADDRLAAGLTAQRDIAAQEGSSEKQDADGAAGEMPVGPQAKFESAFERTASAKTVEDFNGIIAMCEAGLNEGPTPQQAAYGTRLLSWAINGRGEALVEEDAAAALADFERAIQLDENNWKALFNRGVSRAQAGKLEEAKEDFDRVLALRPRFSKAWLNRAQLYYQQGRYREAIADFTQLVRLRPKDQSLLADALLGRGHCHYMLRRYPQAVADYNAVLEIDPANVLAYTYRGDVRFDQQAYGLAAADYRRAVDLDGAGSRTYLSAAWFLATCPNSRYRDAELALQAAQRAIELAGERDWRCLEVMAAAYANAGDFENAVAYQTKALELAPPDEPDAARRLELYRSGRPYRREVQPPSQAQS